MPITIKEHEVYKETIVRPYPHGVVLRAVKSGFEFPHKNQKLVRAGQFVISKVRARQSLWGVVPYHLDRAVIAHPVVVFDVPSNLYADYFIAYLSTPGFRRAIFSACSDQGRLNVQQFMNIVIPLPPHEDQFQVAAFWKEANAALKHTAEMFSSMADTKLGVMGNLFRSANSAWEQTTLGKCASLSGDSSRNYPLVVLPPDQLILGTTLFDSKGVGILPDGELDPLFLYYYLEYQKPALRSAMSSGKSATEDILRAFPLPLPTLYEQRKLTALMQQHDEALLWLHREQVALRKVIEGMLHRIFEGTLELGEIIPLLDIL